jgi:predicted GNAT family acetyltransferase
LNAIKDPRMNSWGIFDKDSGECVSTAQLFIHSPEAAVFGLVNTAESWRRRGLATHLLAKALEHAIQTRGIRRAMLQATPMAVNMYKRMGFEIFGATLCCEYISEK